MLFDEDHKVTGVAAVIRDETARWLEERELKQRLASYEAKSAAVSQAAEARWFAFAPLESRHCSAAKGAALESTSAHRWAVAVDRLTERLSIGPACTKKLSVIKGDSEGQMVGLVV